MGDFKQQCVQSKDSWQRWQECEVKWGKGRQSDMYSAVYNLNVMPGFRNKLSDKSIYPISRNYTQYEWMQYNPHHSSHVSLYIQASFFCFRWVRHLKKQSDGTSRADMFSVDLRSEFLKPLMEPLKQHVSLMGVWRDKLTDSPVNIKCGRSYRMPVCEWVHVWLLIVSTCW